jgi:hypothetical protein
MKSNNQQISQSIYLLTWILNLLALIVVFGSLNTYMIEVYFNSDALFLPSFYKDIFIDGTGFRGWNMNGAPNFFPDIFLYSIINSIIPNFKIANLVFSSCQYMLILAGLNLVLKAVITDINKWTLIFLNVLFPLYILVALVDRDFYFAYQVISMAYHAGSVVTMLYAAYFFFNYLKNQSKWNIFGLIIISFLGAFNDRIFISSYAIPMFVILLLELIWIKHKPLRIATIATSLSSAIAFTLFAYLKDNNPYYKIIGLHERFLNFKNAASSWHIFSEQHWNLLKAFELRSFIVAITFLSLIIPVFISIHYLVKARKLKTYDSSKKTIITFVFFTAGALFLNIFAPIINGNYQGIACLRYATFSYLFSFVVFVFFIHYLTKKKSSSIKYIASAFLIILITVLISGIANYQIRNTIFRIANYYPEEVKVIDEYAKKKNLKYGVANWWSAKVTTLFSHQDLRVYTSINDKLNLWYHATNENLYHDYNRGKYRNPVFNFVILTKMEPKIIKEHFGQPLDSLLHKGKPLVYILNDFKYDRKTRQPHVIDDTIEH